jgi:hypothetical protein
MLAALFLQLLPVIILVTIMVVFAVYVFLQAPKKYYLKWLVIPLSFVAGTLATVIVAMSLGYSVPSMLPDEFTMLSYKVITKGQKKVAIEVLIDGPKSRLLKVPYSKKMEQALAEAKQKGKNGGQVRMKKKPRSGQDGKDGKGELPKEGDSEDQYESNLDLPHTVNPKTPG